MEREIEHKYDLPDNVDDVVILLLLKVIIEESDWTIDEEELVERNFQYYDSPSLGVYKKCETLRRIGGFDPDNYKGMFRYDFKVGPIHDRYEDQYWSNEELSPDEILTRFHLHKYYQSIIPIAYVVTKHYKMKLHRNGSNVELTLDVFDVVNGGCFRELELELENGSALELDNLAGKVKENLKLNPLHKQKYDRVVESIGRFEEHCK